MLVYLNITSPSEMFMRVVWPEGVPYPSIGDQVMFKQHEIVWFFKVEERVLSLGFDPLTNQPSASVHLQVDAPAPSGWSDLAPGIRLP